MFLKRIMLENEQSSSHRPTPPDLQLVKSSRSSSKERREFFVYVVENYNRSAPWIPTCKIIDLKNLPYEEYSEVLEDLHLRFKQLDVYQTFRKKMHYCMCSNFLANLITDWEYCQCKPGSDWAYRYFIGTCTCFNSLHIIKKKTYGDSLLKLAFHAFIHYIIQLMQDKKNDCKIYYLIREIYEKNFPLSYDEPCFVRMQYLERVPNMKGFREVSFYRLPLHDWDCVLKFLLISTFDKQPRPINFGFTLPVCFVYRPPMIDLPSHVVHILVRHKFKKSVGCSFEKFDVLNPGKRFYWNQFKKFYTRFILLSFILLRESMAFFWMML